MKDELRRLRKEGALLSGGEENSSVSLVRLLQVGHALAGVAVVPYQSVTICFLLLPYSK